MAVTWTIKKIARVIKSAVLASSENEYIRSLREDRRNALIDPCVMCAWEKRCLMRENPERCPVYPALLFLQPNRQRDFEEQFPPRNPKKINPPPLEDNFLERSGLSDGQGETDIRSLLCHVVKQIKAEKNLQTFRINTSWPSSVISTVLKYYFSIMKKNIAQEVKLETGRKDDPLEYMVVPYDGRHIYFTADMSFSKNVILSEIIIDLKILKCEGLIRPIRDDIEKWPLYMKAMSLDLRMYSKKYIANELGVSVKTADKWTKKGNQISNIFRDRRKLNRRELYKKRKDIAPRTHKEFEHDAKQFEYSLKERVSSRKANPERGDLWSRTAIQSAIHELPPDRLYELKELIRARGKDPDDYITF